MVVGGLEKERFVSGIHVEYNVTFNAAKYQKYALFQNIGSLSHIYVHIFFLKDLLLTFLKNLKAC